MYPVQVSSAQGSLEVCSHRHRGAKPSWAEFSSHRTKFWNEVEKAGKTMNSKRARHVGTSFAWQYYRIALFL